MRVALLSPPGMSATRGPSRNELTGRPDDVPSADAVGRGKRQARRRSEDRHLADWTCEDQLELFTAQLERRAGRYDERIAYYLRRGWICLDDADLPTLGLGSDACG